MAALAAIGNTARMRSSPKCQNAINTEAQTNALAAIAAVWKIFIFVLIRATPVWSTVGMLATNLMQTSYIQEREIKTVRGFQESGRGEGMRTKEFGGCATPPEAYDDRVAKV